MCYTKTMHLAQYNEARLVTDPPPSDFLAEVERVNLLGDAAPGFVWRYVSSNGNSLSHRVGNGLIINLTTWTDLPSLREFTYTLDHRDMLRRRRDWFLPNPNSNVLWWVPAGFRPSVEEGQHRLGLLRAKGPIPDAFTFKASYPDPYP